MKTNICNWPSIMIVMLIMTFSYTLTSFTSTNCTFDIQSQEDLDAFPSGCTCLEGNIVLTGTTVNDLSTLASLVEVKGIITIQGNNNLADLSGLRNLQSVQQIDVSDNGNLKRIDLRNIKNGLIGNFNIHQNSELETLYGPVSLENIGGDLSVFGSPLLEKIIGFENVNSIGGSLRISGTKVEKEFNFSKLINVGSAIIFHGNEGIISINLSSVIGKLINGFQLHDNTSLTTLEGPASLNSIGGDLSIFGSPLLQQLTGFENVERIGGSLRISNTKVEGAFDFSKLTHVGRAITFLQNESITSINLSNVVDTLSDGFQVHSNTSLTTLDGPTKLKSIASDLSIIENRLLNRLTGFQNIVKVGASLMIANTLEDNLPNFNKLGSVGRNIHFIDNKNAIEIDISNVVFDHSTEQVNDLRIEDNLSLINLHAPESNELIRGAVSIFGNSNLTNFTGFNELKKINRFLWLSDIRDAIFPIIPLESIKEELIITHNPSIENLLFLQSLQYIGGDLKIENNAQLCNCTIDAVCEYDLQQNGSVIGNTGCCKEKQILLKACDGLCGIEEICDGIDNDCDGEVDEGFDKGCCSLEMLSLRCIVESHNQNNNYTVQLTASGGIGPYQYSWSSGNTTSTVSNLEAGTHDITITDAIGKTMKYSLVLD